MNDTSVLVIGGGPGGYTAAIRAAQLGATVTLIEGAQLGGTCLNRGCMPTKALLHSSEVYEISTGSSELGIITNDVAVDWTKVQSFRASIVAKLTGGVGGLIRKNRIKLVTGHGSFTGAKTVRVGDVEYTADRIIIASGSKPVIPSIPGLRESRAIITSTECLELDHIPESLAIIGGGVIGLELGTIYSRFGCNVTIIESQPKLLPLMDSELTDSLQQQLVRRGMIIMQNTSITRVEDSPKGAVLHAVCCGTESVITAEKILVAAGRTPMTEELGLGNAGISCRDGYIETNDRLETCVDGIYAVGDCTGKLMLAHAAMMMGECAAENALGGRKEFLSESCPACAYIGPEFACVGMTEEQAAQRGIEYNVGRFPIAGNGRSLVAGHTDGLIKVIAGKRHGEILGVHILAPSATEIIAEASLAIKLEATVDEFMQTVHCHPTVSEALRESAMAVNNRAIHK